MYKSPLEIISSFTNDTAYKIKTETDNLIMKAVYNVGVNVDKAELIKALEYDRDQYEKGYRDGKKDAPVVHAYWKTKEYGYALLNVNNEVMWLAGVPCSRCGITGQTNWKYCPNCGAIMDAEEDTQETHKD